LARGREILWEKVSQYKKEIGVKILLSVQQRIPAKKFKGETLFATVCRPDSLAIDARHEESEFQEQGHILQQRIQKSQRYNFSPRQAFMRHLRVVCGKKGYEIWPNAEQI